MTLAEFAPLFVRAKRHLRSISKYDQQLVDYVLPALGHLRLDQLTKADCRAYYNSRLDAGVAVATANSEIALLKSMLTEAIDMDLCRENPAKAVKLKNPNNTRERLLSSEESERIFAALEQEPGWIRPFFYTLYFTGMRRNEALGLAWGDVQPEHSRLKVLGKGGRTRMVPLNETLGAELARWRKQAPASPWVFCSPRFPDRRLANVRKSWDELLERAKVAGLTPHDLRHHFVTMLGRAGVPPHVIMQITGHRTLEMVLRYSHSTESWAREAVQGIKRP